MEVQTQRQIILNLVSDIFQKETTSTGVKGCGHMVMYLRNNFKLGVLHRCPWGSHLRKIYYLKYF